MHVEGDAEWRRRERHAERHARGEAIDRRLRRVLPIVVGEVRRRQLRVLRHRRLGAAGKDGVALDRARRADRRGAGGEIEAGDRHVADADVSAAAVHREQRQRHRLPRNDEAVVGHRVERQPVRGQHGILVIAFLDRQTEVDLVARRIRQAHRGQLPPQRAQRNQTGFDRRGCTGVVASIERLLRAYRLIDDGGEAGRQRLGRIGAGELRDAGEGHVDVVEQRRLVLLHLTGNRGILQRVLSAAATAAASGCKPGERRQT